MMVDQNMQIIAQLCLNYVPAYWYKKHITPDLIDKLDENLSTLL